MFRLQAARPSPQRVSLTSRACALLVGFDTQFDEDSVALFLVLLGADLVGLVTFAELSELFHEGLLIYGIARRVFGISGGSTLAFGFLLVLAGFLSGSLQRGLSSAPSHGVLSWISEMGLPTVRKPPSPTGW